MTKKINKMKKWYYKYKAHTHQYEIDGLGFYYCIKCKRLKGRIEYLNWKNKK